MHTPWVKNEFWEEYQNDTSTLLLEYQRLLDLLTLKPTDSATKNQLILVLNDLQCISMIVGVDIIEKSCHYAEHILKLEIKDNNSKRNKPSEQLKVFSSILKHTIAEDYSHILKDIQVTEFLSNSGYTNISTNDIFENIKKPKSSKNLIQLVYKSKRQKSFKLFDIFNMSKKAKEHNSNLEITGMLICFRDSFLQVLEGDSTKVNFLYSKILSDPRHSEVKLINFSEINSRRFGSWSLNNISSVKYQHYYNLFKEFNLIENREVFPEKIESVDLLIEKLRVNPEGKYG